jgi:hypothetical protein
LSIAVSANDAEPLRLCAVDRVRDALELLARPLELFARPFELLARLPELFARVPVLFARPLELLRLGPDRLPVLVLFLVLVDCAMVFSLLDVWVRQPRSPRRTSVSF